MATCGPRALAYLLPLLGKPKESYLQLAKLCGTSDKGTSLEDMRNALKHFGIDSFGYQLNLDDFKRVQTPAILLNNGHFVVLTKVTPDWIEIYDPLYQDGQLQTMALPKQDEGSFLATVLTLSPVAVSAEGDDQASKPPLEGMAAAKANKEETQKRAAQMAEQKKAAEKEWARVKAENKAQGAKP